MSTLIIIYRIQSESENSIYDNKKKKVDIETNRTRIVSWTLFMQMSFKRAKFTVSRLLEVDVSVAKGSSGDHVTAHADGQHWAGRRELLEEHGLGDVRVQVADVQRCHWIIRSSWIHFVLILFLLFFFVVAVTTCSQLFFYIFLPCKRKSWKSISKNCRKYIILLSIKLI